MERPIRVRGRLIVAAGILYLTSTYISQANGQAAGCNRAIDVAGGAVHSLALRADGSVLGWGSESNGNPLTPTPNIGFTSIAAGHYHSLGLKSDGTIKGWGWGPDGQLNIPAPNSDFIAIAAGESNSLGLKTDGSIRAWGCGSTYFLGHCTVPVPNDNFIAVAAGAAHSVGLKSDGTVIVWGCQGLTHPTACDVPASATDLISISSGFGHIVGLKADGTIIAWPERPLTTPPVGADFVAIAAGGLHSLALKADGSIVAWGSNDFGESTVPDPNADFIAIAAGLIHSLGIKSDGTIVAWGWNEYGQSDVPQAGEVDCDDAVVCTVDSCNAAEGVCVHTPDHVSCGDSVFCNGIEDCDPLTGCASGTLPSCTDGIDCTIDTCDQAADSCFHTPSDAACDDDRFCNGRESCDPSLDCRPGAPPVCDDGVACTVDLCNEVFDECTYVPLDDFCDDQLFCNGTETCDTNAGCVHGVPSCTPDQGCDEELAECTASAVPTLNSWALCCLTLLLLVAAKVRFCRLSSENSA